MIDKREILTPAEQTSLTPHVVEKDWRSVAHGHTYQVAGPKLCVDRTVEHR